MRIVAIFVAFFFFAASVAAKPPRVRTFGRTDMLDFRHYIGGRTMASSKKLEQADHTSTWGFYGFKTIEGKSLKHVVDLHVTGGQEKVKDHYQRRVVAQFHDGRVRIFKNWSECRKWGMPRSAAAGMAVPPRQGESLPRQFIAVKGDTWRHIVMTGTQQQCVNYVKRKKLGMIIHGDGDVSLATWIVHPHHLVVWQNHPSLLDVLEAASRP